MTTPLLLLAAAYLIGGIPFGYLLVRLRTGQDVRAHGSGNIGATNVLRAAGRGPGVLTLLLDILKGWFAVWLMARVAGGDAFWPAAAALAVVLGHAYPVLLKFQGGKAVASFVGAALYLSPGPLLAVLVVFVVVVAVTRYISLGSIVGAALFPLAVWLIQKPQWPVAAAAALGGAFIVWRHRANIARLRAGTENVFRFGGTKK
jgi:glycerol-3-phosphate acyltransferase PlsY